MDISMLATIELKERPLSSSMLATTYTVKAIQCMKYSPKASLRESNIVYFIDTAHIRVTAQCVCPEYLRSRLPSSDNLESSCQH